MTEPTICGRRLQPFSEDHFHLMRHFDVSFVAGTETAATARDLMYGVLICSMSREEFYTYVSAPSVHSSMVKWARANCFLEPETFSWPWIGRVLSWIGAMRVAKYDAAFLNKEIRRFQSYLNESKSLFALDHPNWRTE